jgi:hypothetical protein
VGIAFVEAHAARPAVFFYFPKKLIALHHIGTSRTAACDMFHVYKVAITPFVGPTGQLFGHDVGVYVDG